MEIFIYLFIILAVGLIIWAALSYQQSRPMRMPQSGLSGKSNKPRVDFSRFLPSRNFLEKSGMYARIKKSTTSAHVNISPEGFFNLKILIMILLGAGAVAAMGKPEPVAIFIALGIGYLAPDLYLRHKIAKIKYSIARRLPETVDLLGLCIEAGLDFVNAVKWVIDKTPSTPINHELAFVLEEIKWGKPRVQALKDMSRRLDIPEVSSFVQTIIQAERMGTPVAEAFTILSEDARSQRFHRGERIALKAPIKILLPLIFFIMPVIGIVIGGPILLQFMQGGIVGLK